MENTSPPEKILEIVFIYNANSGKLNAMMDSAKKILGQSDCALCDITHGPLGAKREWTAIENELTVPVHYLHLNEITDAERSVPDFATPCILVRTHEGYSMLLPPDVLARCKGSVADLKGRLKLHARMKNLDLPLQ